jgi:microcystin degradation protein MlrC
MRIGIAGIATESSTFSPHRSTLADFRVTRGARLLARYPFLAGGAPLTEAAEWVPVLHAVALPGGAVTEESYRALADELCQRLRAAGPLDGLLLDLHGAMSVVGRTDVEAELVERIRGIVGSEVLLAASMDLHGNVSRRLATTLDLVTCYRAAPHVDSWETRERAAANLVARLRSGGRPVKAWVTVPVLLPGEKTSTRLEPARGLYRLVVDAEAAQGVLDAALWVGYAWADEPRCQAAVVVTGDDAEAVRAWAGRLAAEVIAVDPRDPVAGTAVVLGVGGLRVIVTARRKPYHLESDFTALGLRPRAADLVIVKIGYLEPELYRMAADWRLALTPGGVDQDLLRLGHRGIVRPMYPFDPDMPDPDLVPELL